MLIMFFIVKFYHKISEKSGSVELYNLEKDPYERNNIVSKNKETLIIITVYLNLPSLFYAGPTVARFRFSIEVKIIKVRFQYN